MHLTQLSCAKRVVMVSYIGQMIIIAIIAHAITVRNMLESMRLVVRKVVMVAIKIFAS